MVITLWPDKKLCKRTTIEKNQLRWSWYSNFHRHERNKLLNHQREEVSMKFSHRPNCPFA